MNFRDARDLAIEVGAKLPAFDHTSPVAECWIDRMELILSVLQRGGAIGDYIDDANRYSGR